MAKKEVFLKDYQVPEYLIETVDFTFNLHDTEKTKVHAIYSVKRNIESNAENNFILKADEIEVAETKINGNILNENDYTFDGETFTVKNVPEEFTFEVTTLIEPENNSHLMGVYKSNGMFCSQCEPEGFRRITLHPDRSDILSIFTTTIIADKKKYPVLLSNGNLIEEKNLDNGLHMAKWHDPFKKPNYLFALVAGDLDHIADSFKTMSGKKVDLKVYTDKQNINKAGFAMHSLKEAMAWDEDKFGREYDLDVFNIVAVDAFNMGAMENKGLNIFNSSAVLSSPKTSTDNSLEWIQAVVGHEYFHNWSGNRVTCRDWFQLSLKEGFTVFRDSEFSRNMTQGSRKRLESIKIMKALQFSEDSSPMSHPVQPQSYQEIDNFYTLTVYEKGAEIVRMYKTLLGREGFRKGTDLYFDTFDGKAAKIEDFRWAMETANDFNLEQFHNWYIQEGTPVLQVEEVYNEKSQTLTLKFKQVIKDGQKPFYIPVKYGFVNKDGKDINNSELLIIDSMEKSFEFYDLAEKPVVSLLREFSAPVKLEFNQSDAEVMFLAQNDNDDYNRYQAIQTILLKEFKQALIDLNTENGVSISKNLIDTFKATLNDDKLELPMISTYLELPPISVLEESLQPIEPILIRKAHREIAKLIAIELEEDFAAMFNKYNVSKQAYKFDVIDINSRAIQNTCLSYLFKANEDKYLEIAKEMFTNANNMTIESACFNALLNSSDENVRNEIKDKFYTKWKDDNLVINSWFTSIAANRKICDIKLFKELQEDKLFNFKEPNKVRALAAGFASNCNFHKADSYKAYADLVIKMDEINPHMAAGLVRKFMNFKKYAQPYQDMQKEALEYINDNTKSAGVKEIISKSLA